MRLFRKKEKQVAPQKVYQLPPIDLLNDYKKQEVNKELIDKQWKVISKVLKDLNLEHELSEVKQSASVLTYDIEMFSVDCISKASRIERGLRVLLHSEGVKVNTASGFYIEVPRPDRQIVGLNGCFTDSDCKLPMFLGTEASGESLVKDLAKAPHMLIGGTTGSGKSVCINTIMASLLLTKKPEDLKMILIDPKMVELTGYNGIPHLITDVITEVDDAINTLNWLVNLMEKRYRHFASIGVNSIDDCECFPRVVVVVDELADIMLEGGKSLQEPLQRLLQKSRAAGIHIILATQNPTVKVVPGIIKANAPTRIAFKTSSITDSKVILDYGGADKLLGKGDGLFKGVDSVEFKRFQCTYVSDDEIKRITEYWKEQ